MTAHSLQSSSKTGHDHHGHDDHHSNHRHPHHTPAGRRLWWAFGATLFFAGVEAVGGWWADSLALMGDAGHMVSDASALGLAVFGAWLAKRPPTARQTYGWARAEVLVALVNGVLLVGVAANIAWHAVERFAVPHIVDGPLTMAVAAIGLAVNVVVAAMLHGHGHDDLNVRGAWLHVMGDLLGSLAALAGGAAIYWMGWQWMDPLLSLFICALIVGSSLKLLRDVAQVMLEGVPPHIDQRAVGHAMIGVPGVSSVHDLHIWTLGAGKVMLSAHIVLPDLSAWPAMLDQLTALLKSRFAIEHITLQPELAQCVVSCDNAGILPVEHH